MHKTKLRPHKVLGLTAHDNTTHALSFTTGDFAEIIFSYSNVSFSEEKLENEDKLKIHFEYEVHRVPDSLENYDKAKFENELGDFLVELLHYGLERDNVGFVSEEENEQNRENNIIEPDSQRGIQS